MLLRQARSEDVPWVMSATGIASNSNLSLETHSLSNAVAGGRLRSQNGVMTLADAVNNRAIIRLNALSGLS
jgi:hypothetical protein